MKGYTTHELGTEKEKESDKLLSENQLVGIGCGYAVRRNLYERADGTRYSLRITELIRIESNCRVKK